ncbi:MAG TPA: hypothetical protein VF816_01270 [Rhodocyclaceae bacterium]
MQSITAAQSPLSQSALASYQHQAGFAGNGASPVAPTPPSGEAAEPQQQSEVVSLHPAAAIEASRQTSAGPTAEVFAEIWKDGMKIGTVYTDGHAVLPNYSTGLVGGGRGPATAYLEAQAISRMVGGEVRFVDLPALRVAQTRTQLRAAYGA